VWTFQGQIQYEQLNIKERQMELPSAGTNMKFGVVVVKDVPSGIIFTDCIYDPIQGTGEDDLRRGRLCEYL
jgi:hypothetical protein